MTKAKLSTNILIVSEALVLVCLLSWLTGIDPFGLQEREIGTLISVPFLIAAIIFSFIAVKQPSRKLKWLRIGAVALLALFVATFAVLALVLRDIANLMQEF